MAKKKTQVNNENDGGNGGDEGGKKQKAADINVVVLKIDLHCEGCAGRVVKAVRTLDGVESVRIGDSELNKLTVIGNLDPVKLRQKVEVKTKKKVEVISPAAKKANDGDNAGGENKKKQQKPPEKDHQPPAKTAGKNGGEKPKEIPVTTAVLKVPLHCEGCIRKIHKIVTKTKGYTEMSLDKTKDLVTVKGAIDMKLLAEALQHKLKRAVEIVPGKKEGDGEKKGSGEKKGKGGGNGGEGKDGGGGGEKKGKNKGGGEGNGGGDGKPEMFKMESYGVPIGYPYPQYAYGPGYADCVHAPQLFSDENPNACVVM
ncbi:heavy metal-associated isoprenylated plant protein 3-like [Bidens hawaiensis]|uniref:heavy metal-associated isoprenylated plant protein 3-like n=1 Tax=Bidens hawaiensis TaxID=980011 RepID=UPI00404A25FD